MNEGAPKDNPLEFVTTDQMIDELNRRNTLVLLAIEKPLIKGKRDFSLFYSGGLTACIGAAARAQRYLLDEAAKEFDGAHDDQPGEDAP